MSGTTVNDRRHRVCGRCAPSIIRRCNRPQPVAAPPRRREPGRSACSAAGGAASPGPAGPLRHPRPAGVGTALPRAIISAFWYLRNEEFEREQESVKRDTEIAQQQIRLRLIENQEQLVRIAREIVTRTIDRTSSSARRRASPASGPRSPTWSGSPRNRSAARPATRPTASTPSTGMAAHTTNVTAGPRGQEQRTRGRVRRRARAAPAGVLATLHRHLRQLGVPDARAADRPQRVRRHPGRRVLGRKPGALLRAGRGVEPPRRSRCSTRRTRRWPAP